MQTKQQIKQLLSSAGIRPNRQLGQHFLIDLNLMRLLVNSADIRADDIVLEVGCGTGSLTQALAERAGTVVAVELDHGLIQIAQAQLTNNRNVNIINADILKNKNVINPLVVNTLNRVRQRHTGRIMLVANLPYNVASPLITNLAIDSMVVDSMFVTIQKEVADRMIALPSSADYGTLSIILGALGQVRRIKLLKPTVFWPSPQVDSAMVSFVYKKQMADHIVDTKLFLQIVRLFMGHRRKTLRACTRFAKGRLAVIKNWTELFERVSVDAEHRPEELSPEDYIAIANLCTRYKSSAEV
jgi:16S rRNA (adenine1518-N6/adenine1519-N6)-dimethyltransferase